MKRSIILTLTDEELFELERAMLDDDREEALKLLKMDKPNIKLVIRILEGKEDNK